MDTQAVCLSVSHSCCKQLSLGYKGPNVILGLYECNYSLTRGKELYIQLFEGNREADVTPGKNEFDTLLYPVV